MKTLKLNLLLFCLWLLSNNTSAQIVYTDLIPDSTISVILDPTSPGYYYINLDNDSLSEFSLQHFVPDTINFKAIELRYYGSDPSSQPLGEALLDSLSYPRKINQGEIIGAASSFLWANGTNAPSIPQWLNDGTGNGNWHGGEEGYLGLRFKKNGAWLYGWIRLYIMPSERGFVIKDYAYNRTPNGSIVAGQKDLTGTKDALNEILYPISLYPNPMKSSATIQLNRMLKDAEIHIFNIYGQRVKISTHISGNQAILDRGNLDAGVYFYQICQGSVSIDRGTFLIID